MDKGASVCVSLCSAKQSKPVPPQAKSNTTAAHHLTRPMTSSLWKGSAAAERSVSMACKKGHRLRVDDHCCVSLCSSVFLGSPFFISQLAMSVTRHDTSKSHRISKAMCLCDTPKPPGVVLSINQSINPKTHSISSWSWGSGFCTSCTKKHAAK